MNNSEKRINESFKKECEELSLLQSEKGSLQKRYVRNVQGKRKTGQVESVLKMSVPQNLNDCQYIWIVETTKGDGFNCDMFFYNELGAKERQQTLLVQRDYKNDEVRIRKCLIDEDMRCVVLAQAREADERVQILNKLRSESLHPLEQDKHIYEAMGARDVLLKLINAKQEDMK